MIRREWTEDEVEILKRMYPDHFASEIGEVLGRPQSSIYNKARQLRLECSPEKIRRSGKLSSSNPNSMRTRFKKGHVPANKGKSMPEEVYEKCSGTMFRKGQVPHNHKEVGSERVNIYGYIEVKVAEPNRWKLKHRIVWERTNGEIPKGYNVQFRNRDKLDCRIENLYLISRADQMGKENSYMAKYPKELQEVIRIKGVLNRQIHKSERNGK